MTGTCHCQLPAEQGGLSKEAQVLGHQFRHLVQMMMAFMLWDSLLVDDGGRIVAKSQTVDLDPTFSG
jgi:hypothetical protein